MRDALKNYLALASGLTDVTRQRAQAAAKALVAQGEATAEQVSSLAEDLIKTSRNNRAMVQALVRSEVEKALGRVQPLTEELQQRLRDVESTVHTLSGGRLGKKERKAAKKAAKKAAAKPAAKKAAAKKPAAKKPAKKAAAKKPAAKKPAAKKAAKKA